MAQSLKVGVVGAEAVGSACLMSLVLRGWAREIVVVDRTRKRALAVATDLRYGAALSPPVDIRDGDYPELAGSAVVMVTAGLNEKAGGATDRADPRGRLKLLDSNVVIYKDILPALFQAAADAVILVLTDPPDPLADLGDERMVIPIGSYNPSYGVTLSMPSVLGREGVVEILEPDLVENERQALQRSAETLKSAVAHMKERA